MGPTGPHSCLTDAFLWNAVMNEKGAVVALYEGYF